MTGLPLTSSPLARRCLALLILLLLVWIVAPIFSGPFDRWRENRAALETERMLAERLQRLDARRAAIGALAARPSASLLVANDVATASGPFGGRLFGAVPTEAMRLDRVEMDPVDERPGAPLRARIAFTATQGGLQTFLADIETRPPLLRVDDLTLSSRRDTDGTILLSGTATVSGVALIRPAPAEKQP